MRHEILLKEQNTIVSNNVPSNIQGESFDADFEIHRITRFIKTNMHSAKSNGFVIGLSGGVDSALVAALCQKAVGRQNLLGLLLFEDENRNSNDYADAKALAELLEIKTIDISITPLINVFDQILSLHSINPSKITKGNIKARTRMVLLYAVANHSNYLVAGTGDKSEDLIGFFTKYGDGGVDILPIAHLYKTQVRSLARKLGVPESIVTKPSSPNLWKGHKASDEIPADYDVLDKILALLYDSNLGPLETSKKTSVPSSIIDEVIRRNLNSRHKRQYPPMVVNW